jgi:hypothetical protein
MARTFYVVPSGVTIRLSAGVHRESAFGPMLISEMEAIEQILPTLATRDDLRAEIRDLKVLIEDWRGDYRLMAEHVSSLMDDSREFKQQFALLHGRLDQLGNQIADVLRHLNRRRPERK